MAVHDLNIRHFLRGFRVGDPCKESVYCYCRYDYCYDDDDDHHTTAATTTTTNNNNVYEEEKQT